MQESQPTQQGEGGQEQQKIANPPQQRTPTSGPRLKLVLQKWKKEPKKTDKHQNISKTE